MQRIFWTSRSAMMATDNKVDIISNNLANINTNGYKKLDVSFKDLVSESLDRNGYPISKNVAGKNSAFTGTGVKISDVRRDNSQGELVPTNTKSDFAIDGEGYFGVTDSTNQTIYVRAGNFNIDATGKLVDPSGNRLNIDFDKGYDYNNVKFTNENYEVKENGDVFVTNDNTTNKIGVISLFNATGENAFRSLGGSYYALNSNATISKVTNASIMQGFTENSNVEYGEEMSQMIITQRAFELNSKGIQAADQMWGLANNLRK